MALSRPQVDGSSNLLKYVLSIKVGRTKNLLGYVVLSRPQVDGPNSLLNYVSSKTRAGSTVPAALAVCFDLALMVDIVRRALLLETVLPQRSAASADRTARIALVALVDATSAVDVDHLAVELTVSMIRIAHASSDQKSHCLDYLV